MSASQPLDRVFDPPGPRSRRRIRVASVLVVFALIAIAIMAFRRLRDSGELEAEKWSFFLQPAVLQNIGTGVWATIKAALTAGVFGLVDGTILALLCLSGSRWVRGAATGFIEITRALPTLLLLYFLLLYLPSYGIRIPVFWMLIIGIVITNGSMIAVILRDCLLAVPRGQTEAAMSLGLTRARSVRKVLLPQAFSAAMPALVSQLVYLFKTSTLGYVISYSELLYRGRTLAEYTGYLLQAYLVISFIFVCLNFCAARLAFFLQRRSAAVGHGRATAPLPADAAI